jgi:hypothetical protein
MLQTLWYVEVWTMKHRSFSLSADFWVSQRRVSCCHSYPLEKERIQKNESDKDEKKG